MRHASIGRLGSRLGIAAGLASLLAAIALSWPGVEIARADDPQQSVDPALVEGPPPIPEGATCRESDPAEPNRKIAIEVQRVREEIARRAAAAPEPDAHDGVALNGRGYRYGR